MPSWHSHSVSQQYRPQLWATTVPLPTGNLRDAVWFKQADKDGDGRLSREEAPNKAVFDDVDTDGDGFASVKELQVWLAKQPQRATQPTADFRA
ncbi:MAG: hypothetical protein R3C05_07725 [Pirellulaceae bacterium]